MKSFLKDGMKVVFRNGRESVVLGDKLVNMRDGFFSLDRYDDILRNGDTAYFDIVEIFQFDGKTWSAVDVSKEYELKALERFEVVISGKTTTVTLLDGTSAKSTCLPEDKYSEYRGVLFAYMKAIVKKYNKFLKEANK